MGALPDGVIEAWWGADRALPIGHVLDRLLDQMEGRLEASVEAPDLTAHLLPLSTGLLPLDLVLGGGLRHGTVTVIEADIEAHGTALLATVARTTPDTCLLDGPRILDLAAGLLAGSAGVPEVMLQEVGLSEREWRSLADGLRDLGDQDLHFCSTGSISALANVTRAADVDVVVVHQPERFGVPVEFLQRFSDLARQCDVAVLTAVGPMDELQSGAWAADHVTRLGMHSFDFGGRATLVRPDPDQMLAVAQVDVECLFGIVR